MLYPHFRWTDHDVRQADQLGQRLGHANLDDLELIADIQDAALHVRRGARTVAECCEGAGFVEWSIAGRWPLLPRADAVVLLAWDMQCWRSTLPEAHEDVRDCLRALAERYPVDDLDAVHVVATAPVAPMFFEEAEAACVKLCADGQGESFLARGLATAIRRSKRSSGLLRHR